LDSQSREVDQEATAKVFLPHTDPRVSSTGPPGAGHSMKIHNEVAGRHHRAKLHPLQEWCECGDVLRVSDQRNSKPWNSGRPAKSRLNHHEITQSTETDHCKV